MNISIIIPTYNRSDCLEECLICLKGQTLEKEKYEIIVIDDGSDNDQQPLVNKVLADSKTKFYYYRQKNSGPAAARNKGIELASGEIIIFIGDDIMVSRNFLAEHYNFHQKNSEEHIAMIGLTCWSDHLEINSFMKWLDSTSLQFDYNNITHNQMVNYRYFYTSNVSLKKSFLLKSNEFFSCSFPFAAYEDAELGYRLEKLGLEIIYNAKAKAGHKHSFVFESFLDRMEKVGRSAFVFYSLHPELKDELYPPYMRNFKFKIKFLLYGSLYNLCRLTHGDFFREKYWLIKIFKAYINGYERQKSKNISSNP